MDYETVSAETFGAGLRGIGLNLLTRDVRRMVEQLCPVFGMTAHRVSDDFAILRYGDQLFQVHSDGTYARNPLLDLLPENPPRGAGLEIRLYDTDPDEAASKAEDAGFTVLQPPTDKPHGLRECTLLCADGYAWVPSRPL
ncbi:glyoxalase [uncultured Marivita sp.]|uniref:VOC family protein n=1 Tax=uncultured Marivita sp. TaxID=888080 RepID=UPI00263140DD|nr:glyoxalase [uncultured Marivita sp.]